MDLRRKVEKRREEKRREHRGVERIKTDTDQIFVEVSQYQKKKNSQRSAVSRVF